MFRAPWSVGLSQQRLLSTRKAITLAAVPGVKADEYTMDPAGTCLDVGARSLPRLEVGRNTVFKIRRSDRWGL